MNIFNLFNIQLRYFRKILFFTAFEINEKEQLVANNPFYIQHQGFAEKLNKIQATELITQSK